MPLVKEGRLTALMAIHHKGPHVWTDNELALITEVTERSWAHIERVRSEAEVRDGEQRFREELEQQVAERTAAFQQSEKTIRTIFETSYMNQGLLTTDGKIVYVNATSLASIKSRLEDVVGKDFWETPWFTGTPGMPEKVKRGDRAGRGWRKHPDRDAAQYADRQPDLRIFDAAGDGRNRQGRRRWCPKPSRSPRACAPSRRCSRRMKIEAIGNLTGGIAHDFNNLLMAVLGSLELLRKRLPNEPSLLRLVDNAMEGARRGKSLTERMLAFARKQDLKPERIDLGRLVRGMAELMERSLGPPSRSTSASTANLPAGRDRSEPARVGAAQSRRQCSRCDARRRSDCHRGARGSIDRRSTAALQAGQLCLPVGRPMPAKAWTRRRWRARPSRSSPPRASARAPASVCPWCTALPNNPAARCADRARRGEGTTAEIWLPAAGTGGCSRNASEPPRPTREPRRKRQADHPCGRRRSADPDEYGRYARGPRTCRCSAGSGREALERLGERKFDLLVTDHAMPHMTGAQLVAQARTLCPEIAVILATGYAELPPGAQIDLPGCRSRSRRPIWLRRCPKRYAPLECRRRDGDKSPRPEA